MKRLGLVMLVLALVGCTATPTLTPPATSTPVPVKDIGKPATALAPIEKSGGYKTPVPSAGSMILKMHEAGYDFWERNGDYQWMCDNRFCGCVFPSSVKMITCGMTYDNQHISQFEKDSVNIFLIFGVSDDAIMAVHDAQIQARDIPAGVLVDVNGSVQNWGLRYTNDPDARSLHTSFWIIQ